MRQKPVPTEVHIAYKVVYFQNDFGTWVRTEYTHDGHGRKWTFESPVNDRPQLLPGEKVFPHELEDNITNKDGTNFFDDLLEMSEFVEQGLYYNVNDLIEGIKKAKKGISPFAGEHGRG